MKAAVFREMDRPYQGQDRITQMAQLGSFAEEMLVHKHAVVKVDDDRPW